MPQSSKKIRIPIEDGVITFGTGYEIGPRLLRASRYIYKYSPMPVDTGSSMDTQTWEPFEIHAPDDVPLDDCDEITCGERFENVETDTPNNLGFLWGGRRESTGNSSIWDQTGTRVYNAGVVTSWRSIVHWKGLATPTTYCTGPTMLSTTDRSSFSAYSPTGLPSVGQHLLVYQNRLWISINNKAYFTDILDPTNVRLFGQINPIIVPMPLTCLDRIGVSDIDPGAQSHLLLPGLTQIWVMDGSPGAGNQTLRRYTNQVGIKKQQHLVSTNLGAVFFGTDRQLYLIPPGAVDNPIPIGDPIRNVLATPGEVVLIWRRPYLAVVVANIDNIAYFDFSSDKPKWWGLSETKGNDWNDPRPASNRYPAYDYIWIACRDTGDFTCVLRKIKDPVVNAFQQGLQTGFIFEPGHEVSLRKMHATIRNSSVSKTFTFISRDHKNNYLEKTVVIPSGSSYVNVQIPFTISGNPPSAKGIRGEWLRFEVKCTGKEAANDLGMSALQNWEIEYDVIKRDKI